MPNVNTNEAANLILAAMGGGTDLSTIEAFLESISISTDQTSTNTTDSATETTLALIKAKTDNLDVALSTRLKPSDTLNKVGEVTLVPTVTNVTNITNAVKITDNDTRGTTSALSSVTAVAALSNGTQTLLASAAVTARKGVAMYNGTNRTLFVLLGSGTANTTTSYSLQIPNGAYYEVPQSFANLGIQFSISQATATGTILVTTVN